MPNRPSRRAAPLERKRLDDDRPATVVDWTMRRSSIGEFHLHDALEIGCCRAGSGIFVIGERAWEFHAGDVVVIPPLVAHTAYGPDEPSRWAYSFIDGRRLLGAGDLSRIVPGRRFTPSEHPWLCALAERLATELEGMRPHARQAAAGCALALLVEAARADSRAAPRATRTLAGAATIAPALKLIAERYREPLPVTRLARACGVSASHLRRLFVAELGAAPRDHLAAHRIELAACRLGSSGAAIADIAAEVGFATLSSFNRLFRAHRGCSPREWRRRS